MSQETSDTEKNEDVYNALQRNVTKLRPLEKFSILQFTEFDLNVEVKPNEIPRENPPSICYSFMLRGIDTPWKQPIANCLLRDHQKTPDRLAEIIKDAVHNGMRSGLTIVATVSPASRVIIDAIEILRKESFEFLRGMGKFTDDYSDTYVVDCNIIHHIYDPCRLLRSFRNQLKDKDLIFEMDGKKRVASWRSIMRIFSIDKSKKERHRLRKIGIHHILLNDVELMITSRAAQIFSESVGNEIMRSADAGECAPEHKDTAMLLLFIDKLFDTCNADFEYQTKGKPYRDPVKTGSVHFKFWDSAVEILDTMRFVNAATGLVHRPSCLDKWASTIQGFKNVWKMVHKSKMKCLQTRRFNVDGINNLMQILKLMRNEAVQFYCESSEAPILDMTIMKLVVATGYGYYEIADDT